jgi:hypothetical protein
MRLFSEALCTLVAAGLLAACSGATVFSSTSAIPGGASNSRFVTVPGVKWHQSMIIPCHCSHAGQPAGKRSHKRT